MGAKEDLLPCASEFSFCEQQAWSVSLCRITTDNINGNINNRVF